MCHATDSARLLRALLIAAAVGGCGSASKPNTPVKDAGAEVGGVGGQSHSGGSAAASGGSGGQGGSTAADAGSTGDGPADGTSDKASVDAAADGSQPPSDRDGDGDGGHVDAPSLDAGSTGRDGPDATPSASDAGIRPWPGADKVVVLDPDDSVGGNLSDIFYEPASVDGGTAVSPTSSPVLWAARNDPSTLYRLVWEDGFWIPDAANGWAEGKRLAYPGGDGRPDAEGLTRAELSASAVYVAAERDNSASTVSRQSILRFDTAPSSTELTATHEWNLTSVLPAMGANLGLEAITWVPDAFLVARSFFDETKGQLYSPAAYPDHGTGLFFVGGEALSAIHAFALDHVSGAAHRVATFESGNPGVMALAFDRDVGYLWAHCDDTCANHVGILTVGTLPSSPGFGRFSLAAQLARPMSMTNLNNEGIAVAGESACTGGFKPYFWTDDARTDGHSIRGDSVPCGPFLSLP